MVWGPGVRGYSHWPGKVVSAQAVAARNLDAESVCVQWFGGRPNHIEAVAVCQLKTLSEGLDAQHRAQQDSRK